MEASLKYRPDIQECVDGLVKFPLFGRQSLSGLPENLQTGETVTAVIFGMEEAMSGALVLTGQRLLWVAGVSPIDVFQPFPLNAIARVRVHGLLPAVLTIQFSRSFLREGETAAKPVSEFSVSGIDRVDAKSFVNKLSSASPNIG